MEYISQPPCSSNEIWNNYTNNLASEWHNVNFKQEEKYIFNNELLHST